MRTKVQDRRLLKLIAFLDKLPKRKFDFTEEVSEVKTNGRGCASVACAIGWTPRIFPKLVQWRFAGEGKETYFTSFMLGLDVVSYDLVAEKLFGVPRDHDIFFPGSQDQAGVSICDESASPQKVAAMLREYRAKYPAAAK